MVRWGSRAAWWRCCVFVVVALGAFLSPIAPASAHALPTSYSPKPNEALATPPSMVQIHFSEQLNGDISKIVVVNPSNQEVDDHDSQVSADGLTMTVTLPLLAAGTYIVAWRSHSADDGHIAAASYIFHVERADGTVPPITGPLPSGNIIGGAGAAGTTLDGPTLLQTVAHWLALAALTLLLGIIFWWSFVMPRQPKISDALTAAITTRCRQMADIALEAILGATLVEVALQAMILNGNAQGLFSWSLISSILFHSRQGTFLLLRMALSIVGLACLWTPQLRAALRPANLRLVLPVFGALFALAFVYSGHGGAAPQWWGPPNDLLHLLAESVWVGGLLTLAVVVMPALLQQTVADRTAYLAKSIPAFSVPALFAVGFISISGPLNADTRMTSLSQMWTTAYGVVLSIKIVIFLAMVGISYVHTFRLRPQLATAMGHVPSGPVGTGARAWLQQHVLALLTPTTTTTDGTMAVGQATTQNIALPHAKAAAQFTRQIPYFFRIEAVLGLGVLFCAALLSPLAGTLNPPPTNSFNVAGGTQTITQTVDGLHVTLTITPGKVGTNQTTITVKNPDGTLATGGTVFVLSEMVEMDMGINQFTFAAGTAPGTYQGNVDLLMAGHWKITAVVRTKADPTNLHRTTFTVTASF